MIAKSLQITPLESFTSSLPTLPAIEEKIVLFISRILAAIKQHKTVISTKNFSASSEKIISGITTNRNSDTITFHDLKYILRMPNSLHESLGSYITQELLRQLGAIAQSNSPSAIFAGSIENSASAEISFEDIEYGSHQPDASFQHFEAQYPGVILELSYSQKRQDLSRLAHEYILGSDADIRVVIGIDVEYKGSKKASVSIWRPRIEVNDAGEKELFVVQTITDQPFRDDLGNRVLDSQASLQLCLEDFGTEAFAAKFPTLTEAIHTGRIRQ